jgi:hypothetical protein
MLVADVLNKALASVELVCLLLCQIGFRQQQVNSKQSNPDRYNVTFKQVLTRRKIFRTLHIENGILASLGKCLRLFVTDGSGHKHGKQRLS